MLQFTIGTLLLFLSVGCSSHKSSLQIDKQGSFEVGGSIVKVPGNFDPIKQGAYSPAGIDQTGQTLHGDHAYVFYQIPAHPRKLPLIFTHGHGQTKKTWETTPDGREGFQNIFLRQRFPIYLVDQPRRGEASKGTVGTNIQATADEQLWFGIFRLGVWPDFYENVSFSKDPEALNQFFRQAAPNTGPYDPEVNIKAYSALLDKLGNSILVTHSQGGGPGWRTAIRNKNVKAIVSFEPGGDFVFPEGENVESMVLSGRTIQPQKVSMSDFMALTKIPIIVFYGDNIPAKPSINPGQEQWRVFLAAGRRWAKVVNDHGGDVKIVHLPEVGITGNTHFIFSDTNNLQVADEVSKFLKDKGLDK